MVCETIIEGEKQVMTIRTGQLIEDEATIGFHLLGYTVVFSCKGIEVDSATIYSLLEPLGWESFLPVIRPHTRLKRAIMRWMRDQVTSNVASFGVEEKDEKRLLREISRGSSGEMIVYAIVHEKSDLDQWGLNYLTNTRIFYNQTAETIFVNQRGSGPDMAYDQALQDSFLPYWSRYKDVYITDDIGRLVPRVIATLQPASMKDGGGTYFVPYDQRHALQQLKDIIELHLPVIPGQERTASLTALPVIDRPTTRKNMATLAYKSLESDILEMQKNLERFTEELKTPVRNRKTGEVRKNKDGTIKYMKVRPQTVVDRIQLYRDMRTKIALYNEKLGLQQEKLLEKLSVLEVVANAMRETATDVLSEQDEEEEILVEEECDAVQSGKSSSQLSLEAEGE
jgi:hypothetical protein